MKAKMYCMALLMSAMVLQANGASLHEADQQKSNLSIGADVYNRYIWRGINLGGNTMSIQPSLEYSFGNSGLVVGAWGAFSMGGQTVQEIDLYLKYTPIDLFTITVTDYFFPDDRGGYDYFEYREDLTSHIIEAAVSFNGLEGLPLTALFAMNLHGDEANSTYFELGYAFDLKGDVGLSLFAGATLTEPGPGETGFYGQEQAGLINLGVTGSKELKITETFSLPVSSSLIINPEANYIFMVFGFSF